MSFTSTEFKGLTIFLGTGFDGFAQFSHAEFEDYVTFEEAAFSTRADFNKAMFVGRTAFDGTVLPDSLDLRGIKTSHRIDLTPALLDSAKATDPAYRSLIALEDTDISKINLNMDLFKLWFPGLEGQPEKRIDIYENVLSTFDQDDLPDSYEALDIEYRIFLNKHKGRHIAHFFNKYMWNYGYNKEWLVWWGLGLLGLFTVVIAIRFNQK